MKKVLLAILVLACGVRDPAYVEGGLYSVPNEENGTFTVVRFSRSNPKVFTFGCTATHFLLDRRM
jgi:hypothetical protein